MVSAIAPAIGIAGSLFGGSSKKKADTTAATQANQGYNYLTGNQANQVSQNAGVSATGAQANTQNAEQQLLGTQPITAQTQTGFNNYLNSTGYQFQKDQGTQALTGSAAARGLLGSGSTAKALTSYGQGLASQTFNNYLGNLSGLNTQQQGTVNTGVGAAGAVGTAGGVGGANASQATQAGGNASGNAFSTAAGIASGAVSNGALSGVGQGLDNFFGSI